MRIRRESRKGKEKLKKKRKNKGLVHERDSDVGREGKIHRGKHLKIPTGGSGGKGKAN